MSEQPNPNNIHTAILAVMGEVGYVKKSRGAGLNYSFAGEAALIAALRPAMVENGIYMSVVKISDVVRDSYETRNGSKMNSTTARMVVRFTHAPSNTFVDVEALGEGADSGDKSMNKAATGAYKYALRQTFCIETGDDPDKSPSEPAAKKSNGAKPKTQADLVAYAKSKDPHHDGKSIGAALKAAEINGFDPTQWEAMTKAIDAYKILP